MPKPKTELELREALAACQKAQDSDAFITTGRQNSYAPWVCPIWPGTNQACADCEFHRAVLWALGEKEDWEK